MEKCTSNQLIFSGTITTTVSREVSPLKADPLRVILYTVK